ncbi:MULTISPECIES: acyltransferase domain-containing protein [unclassified Rhizobium]|uniref:ACP S-malonyltransferase n=1 Tax=unclassified Rhizobium TaxID=2613769 RepID=UPI000EA9D1D4|nr:MULTISPECIES: acyltransferase domain-containing protein [unclassified Rhizobium]AYG69290.1 acyltransferase domain-containing protein [Rhizobium sp. CCGE531]AYG75669.1 acyltransferase domain-containing protein [Rhizobium sp. CCGE532]
MTLALLCSGQGHQNREMFGLLATEPDAQPVFEAATAVLGTHAMDFCRTASETALHANREGQILCVTRALAIAGVLFPAGAPSETMVAGYSVGEMAAWGVAGVWSPKDTLKLVDQRARAMDAVAGPDDGLGYVRGLPQAAVEQLAGRYGCAIAIVNPDLLFIVGGDRRSIDALCVAALEEGAARAAPMAVHVASHTPRLVGAVAPFERALASVVMSRPALRLMTASGATLVGDPHRAQKGLARQIAERIDWAGVIEALGERGVTAILELGPGRALAEIAAVALPAVSVRAIDDFHSLAGVRPWLAAR